MAVVDVPGWVPCVVLRQQYDELGPRLQAER